jgi:hypothetical protein
MQLRHISPRSIDWVDAMEGGGGRGWDKLAPEERTKLRMSELPAARGRDGTEQSEDDKGEGSYGWGAASASR